MENSGLSNTTLILGFFDGIHAGHREVIGSAVNYAKKHGSQTVLLTFTKSPAEYFGIQTKYIKTRKDNYDIIKSLGVNIIIEEEFSNLAHISAEEYLKKIVQIYSPISIFTGFNYTFGENKSGNKDLLKEKQTNLHYEYFCINPVCMDNTTVSSTLIKNLLKEGDLLNANKLLSDSFSLEGKVIKGNQTGRTIGFPTANIKYPKNIVQLPYGVYKVEVFNKNCVMNWGTKPTLNGKDAILEVHIPKFSGDLYGEKLKIKVLDKMRDEKKFSSIDELKKQIEKDVKKCQE